MKNCPWCKVGQIGCRGRRISSWIWLVYDRFWINAKAHGPVRGSKGNNLTNYVSMPAIKFATCACKYGKAGLLCSACGCKSDLADLENTESLENQDEENMPDDSLDSDYE